MKQQGTDNSKRPVGYVCTLYGNFGKSYCNSHYITQKALEQVVLADIQQQIDFVMNNTWNKSFAKVKAYYEQYGFLPKKSKNSSEEEKRIATWLNSQKLLFNRGEVSEEHQQKLAEIDFLLDEQTMTAFEKGYQEAKKYYETYHNLDVASTYQTESGFWLYYWLDKMRKRKLELSDEQIAMLDEIGMIWEFPYSSKWEKKFQAAEGFFHEHWLSSVRTETM